MRRPLLWSALGLLPGLFLSPRLDPEPLLCLLACLACALLALPRSRVAFLPLLCGAFLVGLALPSLREPGPALEGEVRILGEVHTRGARSASVSLRGLGRGVEPWTSARGRARVIFPERAPGPGTRLVGIGKARSLETETLPGEPDARLASDLAGERALVLLDRWAPVGRAADTRALFTGRTHRAVLRALALGDRSGIDAETLDLFQRTGTSHLLSISGLHVGLVTGALGWLLALLLRPLALFRARAWGRLAAALGAVIAALGYGQLAGWPVSACRAVIMGVTGALALAGGRRVDPLQLLGGAAVLLCLWDPAAPTAPGWQLSFGAIAGLLLLLPRLTRFIPPDLPRAWNWLLGVVLATLSASLGTFPAQALHFQALSTTSVPANLLAIPLVGALCTPLALAGALLPASVAPFPGIVADRLLDLVLLWLRIMDGPLLHPAVAPWGALLLAVALGLPRRPAISLLLSLLALCVRSVPVDRLTVNFLSVGQGDATLVEHADGRVWLVDGGPSAGRVLPWLRRRGIRRLDVVVLTHAHADHSAGLVEISRELPAGQLWLPRRPLPGEGEFEEIVRGFERGGARVCLAGECGMPSLHPPRGWNPESPRGNHESLVLDVAWGARSFLLTGDLEATEEALLTPDLDLHDVLKVGHHGSCGASSAPFLQALSPRLAIIPVGAGNRLGHPCPAAMGRLAGARRLRTDLDGTIEVSTDGFDLAVRAWRADRGWRHLSWLEETVPNPSALTASGPLALAQSNPAR